MLGKKILKDTLLLNGSGLINQGLSMARSLLIMRLLEPQALGIWLGLVVILGYGAYLNLGLDYGLGFRLPYYRGRGEPERAGELEDSVYLTWTVLGLFGAAGMVLYALLWGGLDPVMRTGLMIVAGMMVLEQQAAFFSRWNTSAEMNFSVPSMIAVVQSAASLIVFVPLAWMMGVAGVMWGSLAVDLLVLVLWMRWTPYRLRWRISRTMIIEAVRIGFPVLIVVVAGGLIKTVDRLLVLSFLGAGALGFYGVTTLGGSFLYGLLAQAGSAIAPHIVQEMGRNNDSSEGLEKFLIRPTIVFAYLGAILILLLLVAVPPLVELLLPKYRPGLTAFYLFVPGFFFLAVDLAAANILNIVLIARRKQRIVIYFQVMAVAVEVALGIAMIRLGYGIAGVALSSTIGYAVYGLSIFGLALRHVLPDASSRAALLGRVAIPFAYSVAVGLVLYLIREFVLPGRPLLRLGIEGTFAVIAVLPMLARMNSEIAFRSEILPLLLGQGGLLVGFWASVSGVARRLRPWGSRA
jgi:O-antigen/teichoic acid export membrane protein